MGLRGHTESDAKVSAVPCRMTVMKYPSSSGPLDDFGRADTSRLDLRCCIVDKGLLPGRYSAGGVEEDSANTARSQPTPEGWYAAESASDPLLERYYF